MKNTKRETFSIHIDRGLAVGKNDNGLYFYEWLDDLEKKGWTLDLEIQKTEKYFSGVFKYEKHK